MDYQPTELEKFQDFLASVPIDSPLADLCTEIASGEMLALTDELHYTLEMGYVLAVAPVLWVWAKSRLATMSAMDEANCMIVDLLVSHDYSHEDAERMVNKALAAISTRNEDDPALRQILSAVSAISSESISEQEDLDKRAVGDFGKWLSQQQQGSPVYEFVVEAFGIVIGQGDESTVLFTDSETLQVLGLLGHIFAIPLAMMAQAIASSWRANRQIDRAKLQLVMIEKLAATGIPMDQAEGMVTRILDATAKRERNDKALQQLAGAAGKIKGLFAGKSLDNFQESGPDHSTDDHDE